MKRSLIIIGIIAIVYLALFSILLCGPVQSEVSSVSDLTNDLFSANNDPITTYISYIDIINAEVQQTNWNTIVLEMTVESPIPLNPGVSRVCYLWFLDTDMNPDTTGPGEPTLPPGCDLSIQVRYDNESNGWYGYVDKTGSPCQFIISQNKVTVTVQLSQIGYPTRLIWWSGTYCHWNSIILFNPITGFPYIMNDGTDTRIVTLATILSWVIAIIISLLVLVIVIYALQVYHKRRLHLKGVEQPIIVKKELLKPICPRCGFGLERRGEVYWCNNCIGWIAPKDVKWE